MTKHDKKRKVSSLKETCLLAIALSIKAMLILVPLSIVIAPFFIFLITALTDHPKRNTAIFVLINVLPHIVDIETIMESELNMINSITDYKIELPQIRIAWIVGFPSALAVSSLMLYSDAEAFVKKHRIRERIRFL